MIIEYTGKTWDDNLMPFIQSIFERMDTSVSFSEDISEETDTDESENVINMKLKKEWNDNEAEIVDFVSVMRVMQKQKKTKRFRMDLEHLFDGTWELDDPFDGNHLLDATPYEEETESDSPLEQLKYESDDEENELSKEIRRSSLIGE